MADATDPKTWSVGDWLAAFGALAGIAVITMKRVLRPLARYLASWFRIPQSLQGVAKTLDGLHGETAFMRAQTGLLMSRVEYPVWTGNAAGEVTHVNSATLKILGVSRADFVGAGWKSFIDQEERDCAAEEWLASVRECRSFERILTFKTPLASVRCHVHSDPVESWDGQVIGHQCWASEFHHERGAA